MTHYKAQRVVSAHYSIAATPAQAREEVLKCKAGKLPECALTQSLRVRFELAYGAPIEEIAFHAEVNWPRT